MQGQDAGAKIHEKVAGRGWMGRKSRPGGERLKTDLRNRREQIRRSDDQEVFPHLAKAAGQGRPVRCEIRLHAAVTVNGAGPGAERIQKAFRISLPPRSTLDEDIDRRDPGHRGTTPLDESAEDPVPKDPERRAGGGRRILGPDKGFLGDAPPDVRVFGIRRASFFVTGVISPSSPPRSPRSCGGPSRRGFRSRPA